MLYDSQLAPIVLISDGNQTIGDDYEFASKQFEQVVFPLILGDSIYHTDLKIQQINVNKYTYLNNKFPVEIIASYSGNTTVQSELRIESGGRIIHKERVQFSAAQNSIILTPKITSKKVGVQRYKVSFTPIENEKNKINNQKSFAIETIDEYTNIALVTSLSHPDLGALKTAIETNKQRLVKICSPSEYLETNDTYGMAILYQPNQSFKAVFDLIEKRKLNTFIIGGTQTQWAYLNSIQSNFYQGITGLTENYQGLINPNFNNFSVDDFTFNTYPPLTAEFGSIAINVPHETLLFKSINGTTTQEPLWFTYENNSQRTAVLLAENLWKWRMHSYREDQNFETFDSFMAKLIQYLNIKNQNTRLLVNYESIYDGSQPLEISAQFFNKNYEPDPNAMLIIKLKNKDSGQQLEYPMIAVQNSYNVNINALEPGNYSFEVTADNGTHRSYGEIEILDFNIEQQFINADVQKLEQLAIHTEGAVFFDTQIDELMTKLISDNRFSSIQKFTKKTVPLIGIKFWLLLLLSSLAIEWFIRKYNGLI
ncbi:VWA domain-containing protein [Flavobacteriaceae bacterium]|nr:VWA domain-containing protein [Flavobacteriaceae bacterium]